MDILQLYLQFPEFKDVIVGDIASVYTQQLVEWSKGTRAFPTKVEKFKIYASKSLKSGLQDTEIRETVQKKIKQSIQSQIENGVYSFMPYRIQNMKDYLYNLLVPMYTLSPFYISSVDKTAAELMEIGTFLTYVFSAMSIKEDVSADKIKVVVDTYIDCIKQIQCSTRVQYVTTYELKDINPFKRSFTARSSSEIADALISAYIDNLPVLIQSQPIVIELLIFSSLKHIHKNGELAVNLWSSVLRQAIATEKELIVQKLFDGVKNIATPDLPWSIIAKAIRREVEDCNTCNVHILQIISTNSIDLISTITKSSMCVEEILEFLCWARNLYILSKV